MHAVAPLIDESSGESPLTVEYPGNGVVRFNAAIRVVIKRYNHAVTWATRHFISLISISKKYESNFKEISKLHLLVVIYECTSGQRKHSSFITQDNSDDENMRRQRGNCYARSNGIIKNFYACSPVVKCDLFKAFCCNMYCSHLWCDFKNETLRRLIVGYNHSFRIIMKYPRHCSASGMFVFNNVPSFKELWRKSIYGFKQRVDNSLNKVVNTVANTTFLSSRLRKHWRTVLYRLPAA